MLKVQLKNGSVGIFNSYQAVKNWLENTVTEANIAASLKSDARIEKIEEVSNA